MIDKHQHSQYLLPRIKRGHLHIALLRVETFLGVKKIRKFEGIPQINEAVPANSAQSSFLSQYKQIHHPTHLQYFQ